MLAPTSCKVVLGMKSPLRELREGLGLTLGDMAAALGVLYSSYYNAETGLGAIPRKAKVALAELGVDVDDLTDRQALWLADRAAARRQAILAKVGAA